MPESPGAHIRPYETKDSRLVHFLIGKANLSVLAVANSRGVYYISPFNSDSLRRNSSLYAPCNTRYMVCAILSICAIHEVVAQSSARMV